MNWKFTSRPQGNVKAYLLELERSKQLQKLKAARNDDDKNEKPSKKAKVQEVELFSSSQASSSFVEQSTEELKEIETLFSGSGGVQASEEVVIIPSKPKPTRTRASKTANLSTKPAITRASKASKVLSTSSTITRASEVKTLSNKSTITLNTSPQASLDVGLKPPSSQYGFSIQPIDVEPNKSHKINTHLINHDVIPSSLPHYRYLELVWFKLKETIEIPSSYSNDERSLKIKLWPAIVISLGSKSNEKPKPFYIRLLGIHKLEKLVFDHDLLPWRSYDYERLRSQLRCLGEIDERIEESMIYKDFESTMTNLSYGIQISIYLHSIMSVSENYERHFIDSSQEENHGNQIWLGAEVLSVGDFIILNETENQKKNKGPSKVILKENEKTCKVMLIGELQGSCHTHKNKQPLYKLKGHLFTTLISKTRKLNQTGFGKDNKDYEGDVASQPYLNNQGKSTKVLKRNSTSGFEFDLIADNKSGKKVRRFTNVVIGRMYSLNHLGRSLDPERIQNSRMSEVCGLRVEENIKERLYIPSRTAAISLAIQTAREDFERDGFKFKYDFAHENWEKKETEMSLFLE